MSTPDLHNAHKFVDGRLISVKIQRVVDAIRDYEPELDVKWIPPEARTNRQLDPAFCVVHNPVGRPSYIMFYVREEDFDERVLYRIIYNDQRNGKQNYDEFSAWEETQKRLQHQEYLDKLEEAQDIMEHALKTKLNTYRINPDLVIQDGIPFNVARKFRKKHLT